MDIDDLIAHTTPIVGRDTELAEIRRLLGDPACRMITLLGPGGIGKTRLAAHAADQLAHLYPDGSFVVSCASITSPDTIIPAIAEAIGLSIFGTADPAQQLATTLRDRRLLLVVDNFDHLADHAHLLGALAHAAPELRLLVTSRERLALAGEVILTLRGLPVDASDQPSDAARLFLLALRRVRPDSEPGQDDMDAIDRICRMVEGMPLALELAASWARVMPLTDIAGQLGRSLDFPADRRRDLPDRHRSMRAAFDTSWERLSADEQTILARLSVFRGPFSREAAEHVAGAGLRQMAALVDQSLARFHPQSGFDLHELLRQYADEKLTSDQRAALEDSHSAYYAEWVAHLEDEIYQAGDLEAHIALNHAFQNVQAGWQRAVKTAAARRLGQYAFCLSYFCGARGLWGYGSELFEAAVKSLCSTPPSPIRDHALARVLTHRGAFRQQIMDLNGAVLDLKESLDMLRALGSPPGQDTGFALCFLGLALGKQHDYDRARETFGEAIAIFEQLREAGNLGLAWCLGFWGEVLFRSGDFAAARQDDEHGLALCLGFRGEVLFRSGDFATARRDDERGLALFRSAGLGAAGLSFPPYLVLTYLHMGDIEAARACLQDHVDWQGSAAFLIPLLFVTLNVTALTLMYLGRPADAVEILSAAMTLPFGDLAYESRANIQEVQKALKERLSADVFDAAWERGQVPILQPYTDNTRRRLKPEFADRVMAMLSRTEPAGGAGQLTTRERQVLAFVTQGLSDQQIAAELVLSVSTVKRHVHHILSKLDAQNRTQAVARARALGLV